MQSIWHKLLDTNGEDLFGYTMLILFFIASLLGLTTLGIISFTDRSIDHCEIHADSNKKTETYQLVQVREYSSDNVAGYFNTFNEAVVAAKNIDCPLK